MGVVSMQSHVSYGHVGHSAAIYPLQRMGVEVWPLHTVHFSSHAGYAGWRGTFAAQEALAALLDGLDATGCLADCQALLTGYLGSAGAGEVALDALRRVRAQSPGARYICDPVLGDDGVVYVRPEVRAFFEAHMSAADVLVPNQDELGWLSRLPVHTLASAERAVHALAERAQAQVVAKGIATADAPDTLFIFARDASGACHQLQTARMPGDFAGTGDVFTATLTGALLQDDALERAAQRAIDALNLILASTLARGRRELDLLAL